MEMDPFKLSPEALEKLRRTQPAIIVTTELPCLCGTMLDATTWQRVWHSGRWDGDKQLEPGVNYTDILCDDCRKTYRGMPRIVCLGCRRLMGFCEPGRQATGFLFEKNRHYHILDCPQCNPRRASTPVLEHEKFCKDHDIPTTTDEDLLQEIEQKILQAEQKAASMREEFESSRPA